MYTTPFVRGSCSHYITVDDEQIFEGLVDEAVKPLPECVQENATNLSMGIVPCKLINIIMYEGAYDFLKRKYP